MPDKLRAVLVGCGSISGAWLSAPTVKTRVDIVGLVDIRKDAAEAKAREFAIDGAAVGTDLDSILKATRPDGDGVVLVTYDVPISALPGNQRNCIEVTAPGDAPVKVLGLEVRVAPAG